MNSKTFVSSNKRVLVKVDDQDSIEGMDIVSAVEPQIGTAVAVGIVGMDDTVIPVGNKVYFGRLCGTDVELEDGKFKSFRIEEILGHWCE